MADKIPTGWQCPVCGTVHAPHINTCPGHARHADTPAQPEPPTEAERTRDYPEEWKRIQDVYDRVTRETPTYQPGTFQPWWWWQHVPW